MAGKQSSKIAMAEVISEATDKVPENVDVQQENTTQDEKLNETSLLETSSFCSNKDEANSDGDNLNQCIEDAIRDVCTFRKTIPLKVAELVQQKYSAQKLEFIYESDKGTDASTRIITLKRFDELRDLMENTSKFNTLNNDLVKIREDYKSFKQLKEIKKNINLNNSIDLPIGEKRKRNLTGSFVERNSK